MPEGYNGVVEQHARPAPPHDLFHQNTLFSGVAVDRAMLAGCFPVAKTAAVKTGVGVIQQFGVFVGYGFRMEFAAAVQTNHDSDGFFLSFYQGHCGMRMGLSGGWRRLNGICAFWLCVEAFYHWI